MAIYLYNKNRPGSGVYRDASDYYQAKRTNALVDVFDYWTVETRANYASIKLYAGGDVVLPPAAFIAEMRRQGLLEKRPIMVDVLIDGGRTVQGFVYGVGFGFKDAIVSTGEDLYHLFLDIFTGEIFNQITDMFNLFMEKGLTGVWDMIKDFGVATWEELQAAWNHPNPYEQGKYFGEIVGAILFEVVLALLTMGIGTAVRQSARVAKILKWFPKMNTPNIVPKNIDRYKEGITKMNRDLNKTELPIIKKTELPEPAKVVETNKTVPESPKKIPTTKPLEAEKPDLVEEKIASEKLPEKENVEGEIVDEEMAKLDESSKDEKDESVLVKNEIETPSSAKNLTDEVDPIEKEALELQAKAELNADPNWKNKQDSSEYAKKLAALTTAKIITAGADLVGLPISVLSAELAFLKALPEVTDFQFDGAADVYKVYMIGSKFLVDGKYTESGDGKYRILGKSKNGNVLQEGDSSFGWQHIVEGHIDGKSGKSMFPKGMSKSKIKELILEASDGEKKIEQGGRIQVVAKFNPSKFGVSEMELWINTTMGNIIETAYPTKGSGVWIY